MIVLLKIKSKLESQGIAKDSSLLSLCSGLLYQVLDQMLSNQPHWVLSNQPPFVTIVPLPKYHPFMMLVGLLSVCNHLPTFMVDLK